MGKIESPLFFMRETPPEQLSEILSQRVRELKKVNQQLETEKQQSKILAQKLKNAVKKLVLTEKKYQYLYESSPDLYRTIDTKGIIIDCNRMYHKKLGYTKNEVIGSSIFDHVTKKSYKAFIKEFETWKKNGIVINKKVWMKKKDGSTFPVLINATNLYDEKENLIGSNTVIRDITEIIIATKKVDEEKLKRLTAIGELSARVAHDLRNPLSVIKNTVELIQLELGENQNEKIKNKFERVTRAVTRINHQVENVLDFVREKPLKFESTSLNSILNFVIDRINVPSNVIINLPKDDLKIMCDFEKLEIVFINLITNAIQAMSNKGEITIRAKDNGSNYVIEVEDNGPGISNEHLLKIFDPLFTTRQIGTGLGLPSCKTIVEAHKGKIEVTNLPRKGTIFRIELPKIQKAPLIS